MSNKVLTREEEAAMDATNRDFDTFMYKRRAAQQQAASQEEPKPALASQQSLDDVREEIISEMLDCVGNVLGELLKEHDEQISGLVARIRILEQTNAELTKARADRTSEEIASLKDLIITRMGGGDVVPLRKAN